jgi:hypothetical protein
MPRSKVVIPAALFGRRMPANEGAAPAPRRLPATSIG